MRWRVPLSWACGLLALYVAAPTPRLYAAGILVALLGEALRLWAAGHLEKNAVLATAGPYRWTRNPLYLGSSLLGLGFAIATARPLLVVLCFVLFAGVYGPVMRREAARLAEAFPDTYPAYAERVPLFLPRRPRADRDPPHKPFSWQRVSANKEYLAVWGCLGAAAILGVKLLWEQGLFR